MGQLSVSGPRSRRRAAPFAGSFLFALFALVIFAAAAGSAFGQDAGATGATQESPDGGTSGADGTSFDADAFFSGSDEVPVGGAGSVGAAAESTGTAAVEAAPEVVPASVPKGLMFNGEGRVDLVYTATNPFLELDGVERSGSYAGASYLRLDGVGGAADAAKLELSILAGYIYNVADDPQPFLQVKKLYLSVYTPAADLNVGRMILNYGVGTVLSPADLFSGVDTSDLDLGRTGSDALRVQVPLGPLAGLDFVATIDRDPEEAVAGVRATGNRGGWDFAAAAYYDGSDGRDAVLSLDCKGDLVLGISAEAVSWIPSDDPDSAVAAAMVGADYSFGGELFLDAEYQWNGSSGARGSFRGEHTIFGSVSWTPDELTALDLRAVAAFSDLSALSDQSWLVSLAFSRNIASGATLVAYLVYRYGDVEGTPTSAATLAARGGAPAAAAGTSVRVSF